MGLARISSNVEPRLTNEVKSYDSYCYYQFFITVWKELFYG